MPGNDAGDRVHNFFQHGNLSQNQYPSQAVEGDWTVLNNRRWGASDRQIGGHFGSKNYNMHEANTEGGQGDQFSLGLYGLNFVHSSPTPEFSTNQSHSLSSSLNGFIHTSQDSHRRHNEANVMGMNTESDQSYPISRGLHTLDLQQRNAPQHSNLNSMSFGTIESPMNFDFLGNQQHISTQQPGPLQSLPGQRSGVSDIQPMQQQFMLRQMQELQRQQQLQHLESLHRNSLNHFPSIPNKIVNHPPTLINETSMYNGQGFPWSSQFGNPNGLQRGASAVVQGNSYGPEQGHTWGFASLVPPQASRSLYGVPVSSTRAAGPFLHGQIDKPGMQHVPGHNSSHSANQHALFLGKNNIPGGANDSKLGFANKSSLERGFGQGPGDDDYGECFNQTQQGNVSVQESGGRLDLTGSLILPEKAASHVASSQTAVALDPTEEKILFGSDDNIWEAFGGTLANVSGSSDHLDGAFPSLHSGSWSALMQAAVAESASGTVMPQGVWSSVGIKDSGSLGANKHSSISEDSGKHLAAWVDDSQAASLSSRPITNDASASYSRKSAVLPFLNQPRVSVQAISAHQSPGEGINWFAHSQPQTPGEVRKVENVYYSAELHSNGISDSWRHQQKLCLQSSQSINNSNSFRIIESSPENAVTTSEALHSLDHDRVVSINVGHSGTLSSHASAPNENIGFLNMFNPKDEAGIHSSSNVQVNQEREILENRNLNFWRNVGPVKSGTDEFKHHQQLGRSHRVFDASLNSSVKGASEMCEAGNADRRENSSDSHSSNISHHALSSRFRYNIGSDIDKHASPRERNTLSVPGGTKSLGPRKFEHHRMGDMVMDKEPVYGQKHPMRSETIAHSLHGGDRSQEQQSMFLHPATNNSLGSARGVASNIQGNATASSGPSSTSLPGFMPSASLSDKSTPPSQNMMELLHKVDRSNDQNSVGQFDSSISTGATEGESSDGTGRQLKKSYASQSFGLQLAPPSQGLLVQNLGVAGQNSSEKVNFANSIAIPSGVEDKTSASITPSVCVQTLPPLQQTSNVGMRCDKSSAPSQHDAEHLPPNFYSEHLASKMHGTLTSLAPGSGYLRSQLQIQQMIDGGGKKIGNQCRLLADVPVTSTSGSTVPNELASHQEVSPLTSSEQREGNLSMRGPSLLANKMTEEKLLGVQSVQASNLSMPCQTNVCTEPCPNSQKEQDYEGSFGRQTAVTSHVMVRGARGANPGREVDAAAKVDGSLSKSIATQKEIETFGRSLRPNIHVLDNNSILQDIQAVKAADMGHGDRQFKRFKRSDNSPDADYDVGQMSSSELNCGVKNASANSELVSPVDATMLNISPQVSNNQDTDTPSHVHDPQRPQMSSSFQQKMMSSNSKNFVTNHVLGRVNVATDIGHLGNSQHSIMTSVSGSHCPPHPMVSGAIAPVVETPRPEKQRNATTFLQPWHEEVALGSQRSQTKGSADMQWAGAANHLVENHEDETDINGDMLLVHRSVRRLILTTQLMQQLLHPPPVSILSLDASSNYETVAYFVARLVLGDACSMICSLASDAHPGKGDSLSGKSITSGRSHGRSLSKLVEDFTNGARKLEDMLRLNKQASILDLRLECQDLERLSVINRFAKFHGGRVQPDGVGTSSSSSTTAVMQKPFYQRYVTAHPLPMNLPDGTECLSL